MLLDGTPTPMDLIVDEVGQVVVNSVHVGAGAQASRRATRWKERLGSVGVGKVNLGKLGYPIGAAITAWNPPLLRLRVEVDGEVVNDLDRQVLQVAVGNGSSVGGGTELTPDAEPGDGQLDVMISRAVGPVARVLYAVRLGFATHQEREDVDYLPGCHGVGDRRAVLVQRRRRDLRPGAAPHLEGRTGGVLDGAASIASRCDSADGLDKTGDTRRLGDARLPGGGASREARAVCSRRAPAVPGHAAAYAHAGRGARAVGPPRDRRGDQDVVGVAGRVIFVRNTGKLCFATLQEGVGTRLQVMLVLAEVGEDALEDVEATSSTSATTSSSRAGSSPRGAASCRCWPRTGGWRRRRCGRCRSCTRTSTRGVAGAAALRRPDRAPGGARHGAHSGRRARARCGPRSTGRLRRGRDADAAAGARRRRSPAVHHPHQRLRPGHDAADRHRALPQAGRGRRRRPRLRDRADLPQRGRRLHPLAGVHDAGVLRGLRRPVHRRRPDARPHRQRGRGRPGRRRWSTTAAGGRPLRRVALAADRRRGGRGGRRGGRRSRDGRERCAAPDAGRHARRERQARRGAPARSSSSSSSSWSRRRWCSRRSSATTPQSLRPLARAHRSKPGAGRGLGPVIGGVELGAGPTPSWSTRSCSASG